MAEPLPPPSPQTGSPHPFPASPSSQVLASDRGADEPAYRPLSLLALAGFLIALLYTLVIGIGALASFLKGNPLLGPIIVPMSWLLPLTGVVVSAIAWLKIQRSEGTRAGTALAVWGIRLCVLLGLGYWAYYAATRFAVCNQAEKYTNEWLATLAKGDPEDTRAAFLGLQTPAQRQRADPKQQEQLEARYNVSESSMPGPLTAFARSHLVRLMRQSGPEAKVEKLGVEDWGYRNGGYQVKQVYRVTTPDGVFEMPITVHGSESRHKEFEGRQWFVVWNETGRPEGTMTPTGEAHLNLRNESRRFASAWVAKLQVDPDRAFFDTLSPAEAARLGPQVRQTSALLAATALGVAGPFAAALLDPALVRHFQPPAYRDFKAGGLIRADQFWSPDNSWLDRFFTWARVSWEMKRRLLTPSQARDVNLRVEDSVPIIVRDDGRLQLAYDLQMLLPPETVVEARLVVETDAQAEETGRASSWRIVSLQIDRVRAIARAGAAGRQR